MNGTRTPPSQIWYLRPRNGALTKRPLSPAKMNSVSGFAAADHPPDGAVDACTANASVVCKGSWMAVS